MVQTVNVQGSDAEFGLGLPVPFDATLRHAPLADTPAVVTIAADADRPIVISQIHCSYDGTPTGGGVQIEDTSGTVVFSLPLASAGPHEINFDPPCCTAGKNRALIVTLLAGGASVRGALNVTARKEF